MRAIANILLSFLLSFASAAIVSWRLDTGYWDTWIAGLIAYLILFPSVVIVLALAAFILDLD